MFWVFIVLFCLAAHGFGHNPNLLKCQCGMCPEEELLTMFHKHKLIGDFDPEVINGMDGKCGYVDDKTYLCINVEHLKLSNDLIPDEPLDTFAVDNADITIIKDGTFSNKTIRHIFIINNQKLTTIERDSFNGVKGLTTLVMYSNQIQMTTDDMFLPFQTLDELENLVLAKNDIKYKPTSIIYNSNILPSLKYLDLSHNPVETISEEVFLPLGQVGLEILRLNSVKVGSISYSKMYFI